MTCTMQRQGTFVIKSKYLLRHFNTGSNLDCCTGRLCQHGANNCSFVANTESSPLRVFPTSPSTPTTSLRLIRVESIKVELSQTIWIEVLSLTTTMNPGRTTSEFAWQLSTKGTRSKEQAWVQISKLPMTQKPALLEKSYKLNTSMYRISDLHWTYRKVILVPKIWAFQSHAVPPTFLQGSSLPGLFLHLAGAHTSWCTSYGCQFRYGWENKRTAPRQSTCKRSSAVEGLRINTQR